MKYVFVVMGWVVWFALSAPVAYYLFDYISWFSLLVGLAVGRAVHVYVVVPGIVQILYVSPKFVQRPLYNKWKQSLLESGKVNPFVGYPLAIFVATKLDEHFEQGGLRQAEKAFVEQVEKTRTGLLKMVNSIADQRRKQSKSETE